MDGQHIQINIVTEKTLRQPQKEPGKCRDLIVCVVGYSNYLVDLNEELQNEIILRNKHVEV